MLSNDDEETLPPVSLSDEDDEIEGVMNGVSLVLISLIPKILAC
jgi:hypothetical protein